VPGNLYTKRKKEKKKNFGENFSRGFSTKNLTEENFVRKFSVSSKRAKNKVGRLVQ
jgi:hypothetical protein